MSGDVEVQPFFLPAEPGTRFALFQATRRCPPRSAMLYVHPFGEETNKSRRMAALQSRAFAALGVAVLQIDLFGCGDSSGDFGDACWEIWKRDLALAASWLERRLSVPLHLWGLRLGATLALDFWREQPERFVSAVLWQPVISGASFMTQFLRLAVAGDAVRQGGGGVTTDALRRRLSAGQSVEVAGYELSPQLVAAVDNIKLADLTLPRQVISWLDVQSGSASAPSPNVERVLSTWRARDVQVFYQAVPGDPFWTTQEIVEAPALLAATLTRCPEATL
jgi:exosortase A-associated hydrolase 2